MDAVLLVQYPKKKFKHMIKKIKLKQQNKKIKKFICSIEQK